MSLSVRCEYFNATEGRRIGADDGPVDTGHERVGDLFRHCQREYGRCTGTMYVEREGGDRPCGWVFRKLMPYEDCPARTYLREVWVTVYPAGTLLFYYSPRSVDALRKLAEAAGRPGRTPRD